VRDAVDATAHETNAHVADGEVVWFWPLDAGVKSAQCSRIALATATNKPDRREEREVSR
jgi:hypothetical protein